ncbi:MAG: hypothetical protein KDG55_06545 [Rhodocyclaceae bacterium]|nr:hypothetical protein [Rhodocyclaceae bacterium]
MDSQAFQRYLDSCIESLNSKQQALFETYQIGTFEAFDIDVDAEELHLLDDGEVALSARMVPIGSYDPESGSWMWGWANEAFPDALREKSARLKGLEAVTGFELFGAEMLQIDEDMAWEIAAMALDRLEAQGVYCGPASDTLYFYALTDIRHARG